MKQLWPTALVLSCLAGTVTAQEQQLRIELEGGVLGTRNMEIRGFQQPNATRDWGQSGAAVAARAEGWLVNPAGWNYGLVVQPLDLRYSDVIKADLNYKGAVYRKGDAGKLEYNFSTVCGSANYPLLQSADGQDYLRAGGSVIARYARVALSTGQKGFTDTNFIVIPVANLEAQKSLGQGYSLFTRADFLPGIGGNVFLDGLYDVFVGIRHPMRGGATLDAGVRLFFGGYDPKKADDYANNIFFNSVTVRYAW